MKSLNKIYELIVRFRGLTIIGISSLVSNAISGLFWLYLASLLGTENYGIVSYFLAISGITTVLTFFGAGNALTVYTAKDVRIQPALYLVTLLASSVASIVLFFMFHNIGVSLFVLGNVIFGLVTYQLLGSKSYKVYAYYLIGQKLLMVILAIGLYHVIRVDGVILGIALSYFLASFSIYQGFKGGKIDFLLLKSRLGFILNSYLLDLTRAFNGSLDKVVVAPLLGFALLGNYQLGMQFLNLLIILPSSAVQYLLPHEAVGRSNKKLKQVMIICSVILAVLGVSLSPVVIPIFFPKFTEAVRVIQIMSLSIIPLTINLTYIAKFLGQEKSRLVLVGSTLFLSIQIPLIILLSKMFGIIGTAFSYVIASACESIYLVIINRYLQGKEDKTVKNSPPEAQTSNVMATKKSSLLHSHPFQMLLVSGIIGLVLRLYYFPYNVPLTLDALNGYFFYATDMSILGHLPDFASAHNGWPIFLSFFFSIFRFDNPFAYMNLQRVITVSLSILTIIPVYFLCRRFIERPYAVVGASIFAFDPRLIQNSLLGITEPLYIFLLACSFAFYFSSKSKVVFISFALVGLASLVRAEALFTFFPMIVMFYVRNRKEGKIILKTIFAAAIFILLILPISLFRISIQGNDALTARIFQGTGQVLTASHSTGILGFLNIATENVVKLGGWSLVPIFMILLPIGLYFFIREKNIDKITILVIIAGMILPILYALSFVPDPRYMYPLFPLFSIIAAFAIRRAVGKTRRQSLFLVLIIGTILLSSGAFLEIKKFDYEHQKEAFGIAREVVNIAGGINSYYPEDSYITPAELPAKWPTLKSSIDFKTIMIPTDNFNSLTEYIKSSERQGLTHLVVDGQKNRPSFLNDVYYHQEKYPYLVEIYDSSEHGFKYHVKIFKIDYQLFNSLTT